MSSDDQKRWDRQHANQLGAEQPSSLLREILDSDSWEVPRGPALDIATGKGRNALFLAERGFSVAAIDVSPVALQEAEWRAEQKSLSISWQHADLEQTELPESTYDLIINFNYLQRSLIPQVKRALKVGGHVIFETYLVDQQHIGHPKNPDYLLKHNELLDHFRNFRVLFYREGQFSENGQPAFRAGIFARKID